MIKYDPVLLVAIPLFFAFLTPLFHIMEKRVLRFIPLAAVSLNLFLLPALIQGAGRSYDVYTVGGWSPPYGISMLFNVQTGWFLAGVNAAALFGIIFYMVNENRKGSPLGYSLAFTLALTGVNGMMLTGDLFNLFVFMEITAISAFIIATHEKGYFSTFRYVILSSVGSLFFLIAVVVTYKVTGVLDMTASGAGLQSLPERFTILLSAMFVIALSGEGELLPLNGWVSGVYKKASGSGGIFFAGVFATAAIFTVSRLMVIMFSSGEAGSSVSLSMTALGMATLAAGEISAFTRRDARSMMGFSSVSQAGLVIAAVGLAMGGGTFDSMLYGAAMFQLFTVLMGKTLVMAALAYAGVSDFKDLAGLGRAKPLIGVMFTAGMFSLAGIPGFAGFWSKLYLVKAVVAGGRFWFLALFLTAALLEIYYFMRLLQLLFFASPSRTDIKDTPRGALITGGLLTAAVVAVGLFPSVIYDAVSVLITGGM